MVRLIIFILSITFTLPLFSENRIQVAVIDTGISYEQSIADYSCKGQHRSLIDQTIYDRNGHGTNIIGLIAKGINSKTHCIVSYKFYSKDLSGIENYNASILSLLMVYNNKNVEYMNLSFGGMMPARKERLILHLILKRGIKVVAAAGNDGIDLDKYCVFYPACYRKLYRYRNFYVVMRKHHTSSYGKVGNIITDSLDVGYVGRPVMSGTSQAAAVKMSLLLNELNR